MRKGKALAKGDDAMKNPLVDEVNLTLVCRECGRHSRHFLRMHGVGGVSVGSYSEDCVCACGGVHRVTIQAAITLDPERFPILKVTPA
jgi:hypothetical protein